jgi:hypothetical protein
MKTVWVVYEYWYSSVHSTYLKTVIQVFASKEEADEFAKTEQIYSDRMKCELHYEVVEVPFGV